MAQRESSVQKLLDSVDAALTRVDARLDRAAGEVLTRWTRYVLASVVGALVVGALLHSLLAITGPGGGFGWVGVAIAVAVAAGLLMLMVRNYLVSKAEPQDRRPFLVAMLVSTGALAAWVEAFAGVATLASRYGMLYPEALPLWRGEQLILWQLVNAVPLLAIPRRLGWDPPLELAGLAGGILVLAFKAVVIATLLRMAVAIYQRTEQHWRTEQDLAMRVQTSLRRSPLFTYAPSFTTEVLLATVALGLVYTTVGADSPTRRWVTQHVPNLEFLGITINSSILSLVPQLFAIAVIGRMLAQIPTKSRAANRFAFPSDAKKALAAYAAIVIQVAAAAAAALLVLHDAGLADVRREDAAEGTTSALALLAVAWHLLDALSGSEIPETLGWTLTHAFVGLWAGVVVLIQLVATFALLIFPMARVITRWGNLSSRWTTPNPPLAEVPASLASDLGMVMIILDRHEDNTELHSIRALADMYSPRQLRPPNIDTKSLEVLTDLLEAERRLTEVERARRKMWELFADAPVYVAANRAIWAVHQRYQTSTQTQLAVWRGPPKWLPKPQTRQESRQQAAAALAAYQRHIGSVGDS
jgi:hypothetical protein